MNIAPLRNVAMLTTLLDRLQSRTFGLPGMATYYGPSGWGKTTAVTFATNSEHAPYCVQVKDCWTKTYFLKAIMTEIGLPDVKTVPAMVDAISEQLAITNRPLIIDDAQYLLKGGKIELARDIYESSQTSVILVGEEKLPQELTRWENIHNRMLEWAAALPCNVSDAAKLAEIYCHGVEVRDNLLQAIVHASGGSIRRVVTNLDGAREMARQRGVKAVDLDVWGKREFTTGQAPAVRQPEELRPMGMSTGITMRPAQIKGGRRA